MSIDWGAITHPLKEDKTVYTFSNNRECHWCRKSRQRSAGRWVTKAVWVCHQCNKEMEAND